MDDKRAHKLIAQGWAVPSDTAEGYSPEPKDKWTLSEKPLEIPKGSMMPRRDITPEGKIRRKKLGQKLNLGCGNDIRKGFVNIDCRRLKGVDQVLDVSDLFGFENVVHILANDIIEHFPQANGEEILQDWIELLVPGGVLEIRCPDVKYASKIMKDDLFIQLLYGAQDYPENFHKAGYTLSSMKALLKKLGMTIESAKNTPEGNLVIRAVK
jgi:predicted SAM-dependent methyltransferase